MNRILVCIVATLAFAGCAPDLSSNSTLTAVVQDIGAVAQAVEPVAADIGLQLVANAVTNGDANMVWNVPQVLNSISAVTAGTSNQALASQIISSVKAATTAVPSAQTAAQALATAFLNASPATQAQQSATLVSLANGLFTGISEGLAPKTSLRFRAKLYKAQLAAGYIDRDDYTDLLLGLRALREMDVLEKQYCVIRRIHKNPWRPRRCTLTNH